jgi:hypothetical protein
MTPVGKRCLRSITSSRRVLDRGMPFPDSGPSRGALCDGCDHYSEYSSLGGSVTEQFTCSTAGLYTVSTTGMETPDVKAQSRRAGLATVITLQHRLPVPSPRVIG